MLIYLSHPSQENTQIINDIKKYQKDEPILIHSINEIPDFVQKHHTIPLVALFFVKSIEETREAVEKIHHLFEEVHQFIYCIAISETVNKKSLAFFQDNFEFCFFKPILEEELIKEIKKGWSMIESLNRNLINEATLPTDTNFLADEKKSRPILFFDSELIGVQALLHQAKSSPEPHIRKKIYEKIKRNIVWPGRALVKNIKNSGFMYDERYFNNNQEMDQLEAKMLGFIEYNYMQISFLAAAEVSPDEKEAFGFLFPIDGKDERDGLNSYFEGLQGLKILKGIPFDELNTNYHQVLSEKTISYTKLAQGKLPENGCREYTQLLRRSEHIAGKLKDRAGTIDFREHSEIININKDELVAKKIPEKPAINGYLVTGKELPAVYDEPKTYVMGENIKKDGDNFFALVDGMFVFDGNTVHLRETILINGNVNLKTGNIHSNKNVIIKGDVTPGMYVEAKGNVLIEGIVEDAKIVCGGELQVHGFEGSGKTWVFTRGKISFDFCENSHIESLSDIQVKKFIINSQIFTSQKVIGLEKSRIIGGVIEAAKGAELYDIGNIQEVLTKVVLGINFYSAKAIPKILEKMDILKKEKEELIKFLNHFLVLKEPLEPQLKKMKRDEANALIQKITILKQKHVMIRKLDESFQRLTQNTKDEFFARLNIKNTIFPGVEISIASATKKIKIAQKDAIFSFSPVNADIIMGHSL